MHTLTRFLFGLVSVATLWPAQQLPNIRTDVNLVQLHAKVTDTNGHAVSGLGKEAFRLFVDDVAQAITVFQGEDAPVTAGIVIDNSGSMGPKQKEVISAALSFARASNPEDEMFVVHFNDHARFGLPQGTRFTGDVSELERAISAFEIGGTTAFYDALLLAESQLEKAAYSRKVLLTITDGGDNSSDGTLKDVLTNAARQGVVIYPIGIFDENDRDWNPQVLKDLAASTGGQAFFPEQLSDVTAACNQIAKEIRSQYTLGFPGAEDGEYHRIRVTVSDPRYGQLKVHTRSGYTAIKSSGASRQKQCER